MCLLYYAVLAMLKREERFCEGLFLSAALAANHVVSVRWPLRYELLISLQRKRVTVAAIWIFSAVLSCVALSISLNTISVSFPLSVCCALVPTPCLSGMSTLVLYCTVGTGGVVPLCSWTILGCFCLFCWDVCAGLLYIKRACVTLTLWEAQATLSSVPVVKDSYLIPRYLHRDALDIATTLTYSLGASLMLLVHGYLSQKLQQTVQQAAHRNRVNDKVKVSHAVW